jgi:hypothetical protein
MRMVIYSIPNGGIMSLAVGYRRFTETDVITTEITALFIYSLFIYRRQQFSENTAEQFLFNNQPDALINQIHSVIKLHMFRASSLPIIRSSLLTFGMKLTSAECTVENS